MQDQFHDIALRLLKRGAPTHKLAFHLGISVEELRNLEIWETLYQLARSGRHLSATIFWLKARAGALGKQSKSDDFEYTGPPPIIRVVNNDGEPVDWD
jgi:hypothetical protein